MPVRAIMSSPRHASRVQIPGPAAGAASAKNPGRDDYLALRGLGEFRGLVDMNKDDPVPVLNYLNLIIRMDKDVEEMGLDRHIVVAMRGGSVQYLLRDRSGFTPEVRPVVEDIAHALGILHARNVRIEACKVAMDRFHVPVDGMLNEVIVVNNTFITLIGFQQQGYGLVSIS